MYKQIIASCPLFCGMPAEKQTLALQMLSAVENEYPRGSVLASSGERLYRFGLLLKGTVQVSFTDIDGNSVIMASVTAGDTFGESLCWLGVSEIPVTITAFSDVSVCWLSLGVLSGNDTNPLVHELRNRFASMLAQKTLSMNDRIQILTKPTIRQKLITFFSQYQSKNGAKTFSVPFDRETLAMYLGVNRSALSRELSAMRDDGIIEFYKNTFKILK